MVPAGDEKSFSHRSFVVISLIFLFLMTASRGVQALPLPTVATGPASLVSSTEATLTGTVNASGSSITVSFEYGSDDQFSAALPADQSPVTGSTNTIVSVYLGELLPNTTYFFRVVGVYLDGTIYGEVQTFTTQPLPPGVVTLAATSIDGGSATLNGIVNPHGDSTEVSFEYGTTTGYGTSVPSTLSPLTGVAAQPAVTVISGLAADTTYHFRVVGTNNGGTGYGNDMTFYTGTATAPSVTTLAATGVSTGVAVVNGFVNANHADTVVIFEYGLDTNYGSMVPATPNPVSGGIAVGVSAALSDLEPAATYHFRVTATNAIDSSSGQDMTFTTLPQQPAVTTNAASSVGISTATLNGTVNANNAGTTVTFQYGTTTAYGTTVTATPSPVSGTADTAVSRAISGLSNGTTYHFRVVAVNGGGISYGADRTFTAGIIAPTAITNAATAVGTTTATLNGTVNAGGTSATVTFEYGETTAYTRSVSAIPFTVTGSTNSSVFFAVAGLTPGAIYHYRVVAENGGGVSYGADMTFLTQSPPTVTTTTASGGSETGVNLNGSVNANGNPTTVTFEYGLTAAYGTTVTADQSPVTGASPTSVGRTITGLSNNTTYHYRAVGQNTYGTTYGADMIFATAIPAAPEVTTDAATFVLVDGATLNGTVDANNLSTTITFEYGLTAAYGTTVTAELSPVEGAVATRVSGVITGLASNQTYHYRVVGINANGTMYGNDISFTTGFSPSAITGEAMAITSSSASLNGIVNANNQSWLVFFDYGTTIDYGATSSGVPASVVGNMNTPIRSEISGLTSGTLYHFRIGIGIGTFNFYGSDQTFTTAAGPTVITNAASAISADGATLNGTVNSNGGSTAVTFEYGPDINYRFTVTALESPVTGSIDTPVSYILNTLEPNTTYHYIVNVDKNGGVASGADMTFTTSGLAPSAITGAVTQLTGTGATLNGIVRAHNDTTTATFEYGLTTAYGTTVTADQSPLSGNANTAVSVSLTGLVANSTYHYRVAAQNGTGITYGADGTFFTSAAPPSVVTLRAYLLNDTDVILTGMANANNDTTTLYFEYGSDIGYDRTMTADQSPLVGNTNTTVSAFVGPLVTGTLYHYRLVGENAVGIVYGDDMTFIAGKSKFPWLVLLPGLVSPNKVQ